jgi:L-rhamnose isomerase/sugar isomerase
LEAIQLAYAQALLVDTPTLGEAQAHNDVVMGQELLQDAYRTDVRPLIREARLRRNAALSPIAAYRNVQVREQLIKERGLKTIATGL